MQTDHMRVPSCLGLQQGHPRQRKETETPQLSQTLGPAPHQLFNN